MAIELMSALKTLHSFRLIHGDIAPSNIMWDDNDTLILIDYDCVQFIKRELVRDPFYMIGQEGFVSPDFRKTFLADIFSSGKVTLREEMASTERRIEFVDR
jgi:serine/threonine protein kinase